MNQEFKEKYFVDESNSLRYFEVGAGKTIIFLHGGGVNALTYDRTIETLSSEYTVIAPDLPCFGKSSTCKNAEEYFSTLEHFVAAQELPNVAIVGHSLGGLAALELAARRDEVNLLVIANSAGISDGLSDARFFYNFAVKKSINDILLYKQLPILFKAVGAFIESQFRRIPDWGRVYDIANQLRLRNFSAFDKVTAKTLILWGENDELFPATAPLTQQHELPSAELHYKKGNHDWCLFNPDQFSQEIVSWLKSNKY